MSYDLLLSEAMFPFMFEHADRRLGEVEEVLQKIRSTSVADPWFRDTLAGILAESISSYKHLKRAWDENSPSLLCWAGRNLLELRIWSRFVVTSPEFALRFWKDWIVDGIEALSALQAYGKRIGDVEDTVARLQILIDGLLQVKANANLPPKEGFLPVSLAAKAVGLEEEFRAANKYFSKLVHPTAWVITGLGSHFGAHSKDQQVMIAWRSIMFHAETIGNIRVHFEKKGVEPDFPPIVGPWKDHFPL